MGAKCFHSSFITSLTQRFRSHANYANCANWRTCYLRMVTYERRPKGCLTLRLATFVSVSALRGIPRRGTICVLGQHLYYCQNKCSVLRKFRGKLWAITPLKIRMPCHSERSEESRAGTENYTARDLARFFANAQNDIMLQGFAAPKFTKNRDFFE